MDFPARRCPKHDVPLLVRSNVQGGSFDFASFFATPKPDIADPNASACLRG